MRLCFFLLIAGILDAVLTHFGIASGFVVEGNPMMKYVIEKSWTYFYTIKIFLPIVLIGLFYFQPLQGWLRTFLISTCVLYLSVLIYHLAWILFYLNPAA